VKEERRNIEDLMARISDRPRYVSFIRYHGNGAGCCRNCRNKYTSMYGRKKRH